VKFMKKCKRGSRYKSLGTSGLVLSFHTPRSTAYRRAKSPAVNEGFRDRVHDRLLNSARLLEHAVARCKTQAH
jgi:hypothetical protein